MAVTVYRTTIYGNAASIDFSKYHLLEREVAGCNLRATLHPPRFAIPRHAHHCPSFFFLVQGGVTEQIGVAHWECRPLSFVFTPPGMPHADRFHDRGGRCLLVQLGPGWLQRLAVCGAKLDEPVHAQSGPISRLAANLYSEAFRCDATSTLAIEGLVLEILAELGRQTAPPSSPRWVTQAQELLHGRFSEALTLDELARQLEVHPVHLATTFKRCVGQTVGQYVRRLRIEFAARKLGDAEIPLSEIALTAGFCDQSHFSRTFKQHMRMTPLQYRQYLALPLNQYNRP